MIFNHVVFLRPMCSPFQPRFVARLIFIQGHWSGRGFDVSFFEKTWNERIRDFSTVEISSCVRFDIKNFMITRALASIITVLYIFFSDPFSTDISS